MWPFSRRSAISVSLDAPAEIRELLELLDRLRSRSRSSDPPLDLGPCLSAEELVAFESKHNIKLPIEYRNFLQFAGNGGAGPDFGLIPLEQAIPSLAGDDLDMLSMPFPHTVAIDRSQYEQIDEDDPFWDTYYSDRLLVGCLRLVDSGCGRGQLIVVNGPAAGTIWIDARDYSVFSLDTGFFAWYRDWLEAAIKGSARLL